MARHHRTCTLCEATCGIVVTTEGGRVTDIRGDPDDPFSRGHICPKAVALRDVHEDPDRLRTPLRREGTRWVEVGWDEALDEAATRLRDIRARHGADAIASYVGNPTVHSLGAMLAIGPFLRALGTRNRYSATSVDQLPHHVAALLMFGHALLIPVPDLDRTDFLLVLGANPLASNGSLMTAPGVGRRLADLRARGGRVVVVDPRRTETAAAADAHHFIRPGTDALLLLALLATLFEEGLARPGRVAAFTDGVEALARAVQPFPAERVAAATGIAAPAIRQLARDFAAAPRAVAYGRVGVSMQAFGGVSCWLLTALNLVTGRLDEPGGAMFTRPAADILHADQATARPRFGRWHSRVRGLPEFAGELPVATLADEMEVPGAGQVRALVTHAGNPVLSTPNGTRLGRALAGLEYFVAVDYYLNETTRHAHLILPPASPLAREHYDLVFHLLAVRNTAKWSDPVVPRAADERHDWEILGVLAGRLATTWQGRIESAAVRALGPRRIVDWQLRRGPYGAGLLPWGRGLSVAALRRAQSGLDLGALVPMLPARLRTKDRRIHLAPEAFVADLTRVERMLEGRTLPVPTPDAAAAVEAGAVRAATSHGGVTHPPLALIGRRDLRSCNSWMHNAERLVRGKARCTLLMHPDDAMSRGLVDGATVRVRSRVGEVTIPLRCTDAIMPGVVSLPHGWGHGQPGTRLTVANTHAGASINDLTDERHLDDLTGNAGFSGVPVTVDAAGADAAGADAAGADAAR